MPPLSEKKRASNAKWDAANLKRMSLAMPLELFGKMQSHIEETKETMNGFIKRAIVETLTHDERIALNKCSINNDTPSQVGASKAIEDISAFLESKNDALGLNEIVESHDQSTRDAEYCQDYTEDNGEDF